MPNFKLHQIKHRILTSVIHMSVGRIHGDFSLFSRIDSLNRFHDLPFLLGNRVKGDSYS